MMELIYRGRLRLPSISQIYFLPPRRIDDIMIYNSF
jgi:hypothetical protein